MKENPCPICRRPLASDPQSSIHTCKKCGRIWEGNDRTVHYDDMPFSNEIGEVSWGGESNRLLVRPKRISVARILALSASGGAVAWLLLGLFFTGQIGFTGRHNLPFVLVSFAGLTVAIGMVATYLNTRKLSVSREGILLRKTRFGLAQEQFWSVDRIDQLYVDRDIFKYQTRIARGARYIYHDTYTLNLRDKMGHAYQLLAFSYESYSRRSPLKYDEVEDSTRRLEMIIEDILGIKDEIVTYNERKEARELTD